MSLFPGRRFLKEGLFVTGVASFEWLDDAFIALRSKVEGMPESLSVIGRDEAKNDFEMLHSDERGASRIYAISEPTAAPADTSKMVGAWTAMLRVPQKLITHANGFGLGRLLVFT